MSLHPNLGPKQRAMRRTLGIVAALVTIGGAIAILCVPLAPAWMWLLFAPAFVAALGFHQSAAGT